MRRPRMIIFCMLALMLAIKANSQEEYSLKDVLSRAEEHYPSSASGKLYAAALQNGYDAIKASLGPMVNLNGKATWQSDVSAITLDFPANLPFSEEDLNIPQPPQETYKLNLEVYQPIYQGGARKVRSEKEKVNYDLHIKSLSADLSRRKQTVASLFFGIKLVEVSKEVTSVYLEDLRARLKIAESGVEHGAALSSDADLLRAEIAQLTQQLKEYQSSISSARESLAILTGDDNMKEAILSPTTISIDTSLQLMRTELDMMDLQVEKLNVKRELIQTGKKPELAGFGQFGYGKPGLNMFDDSFSPYAVLGLQLNWKLYDNKLRHKQQQALDIQKDIVGLEKESLKQGIESQVAVCLAEIKKLEELLKEDAEILRLREKVSKAYASKFEHGAITSDEYLKHANEALRARLKMEARKINLEKAKAEYLFVIGKW